MPFILPAILACGLYLPTLKLPLIYDTLLHIRIAGSLDFRTVWLPTEAFGFYRPFTFLPFLLIEQIWGKFPAWLLHGINVGQHAINATLVAGLVWRLWGDKKQSITAGILFALFPFSYQAVAVYGHNVHPTITGLILLGLHSSLNKGKGWLGVTIILFCLALLHHESAILFGAFIILLEWQRGNKKATVGVRFLIAGILYLILYQFLPITRAPQVVTTGSSFLPKLLYLGQAFAYPFTWWAHRLPNLPATTVVFVGVSLTLISILGRCRHSWRPLFFGCSWFILGGALVALPLPSNYLLHGPRLLYLGSVGLAIGWSALIFGTKPVRNGTKPIKNPPKIGRTIQWGFLIFLLITNSWFVWGRLKAYQQLTEPIIVAQKQAQPDAGILFVNLPQWLAPTRNTYPIGAELVAMLGDYLFVHELTNANGLPASTNAVVVPDLLSPAPFNFALHEQSTLDKIDWEGDKTAFFITRYANNVETEHAGTLQPPSLTNPPIATFGAYQLLASQILQCNGEIEARFVWGLADRPAPTHSIFVQAFKDTELIAQADAPPLTLRPDLLTVPPNWEIVDIRRMPAEVSAGIILLGVYDYTNGNRLPATSADGAPLPDNAFTLPVEPCR